MFVPYFDITYLIFSLPAILIGVIASLLLNYWTKKYDRVININQINGIDLTEKTAKKFNLDLRLQVEDALLSDNYNPLSNTLSLSHNSAYNSSITSVGITAHELGHAIQHQQRSPLIMLRTAIVPVVSFGSSLGYLLLIVGIIIGLTQLAWVGIILFSGTTIFSLVTLPVEIDASRRGLALLKEQQVLFPHEFAGVKKVLSAAALTYIAATLQSLGSLLYFIFRVQGLSKRD